MRSIEFLRKAEGIKSHELSVESSMDKLGSTLLNLEEKKSSLKSKMSSLYLELRAASSDIDEDGEPNYGLIAAIKNRIHYTNEELFDTDGEISQTSSELERVKREYEEVEEEKAQTLFEIQERARITSQNASKVNDMFGSWASVGASLNQSFQAKFDSLAQAATILDGTISEANAQTSNSGGGSSRTSVGAVNLTTGATSIATSGMITSTSPKSSCFASRQTSRQNSLKEIFRYNKGINTNSKGCKLSSIQTSRTMENSGVGGKALRNKPFNSGQSSHNDNNWEKNGLSGKKQNTLGSSNPFKESLVCKPQKKTSIFGLNVPDAVITEKYFSTIYRRLRFAEKNSYSILVYALKKGTLKIKSANSEEEYYDPNTKEICIDVLGDEMDNEGSGTGFYHEMGHAIDHLLGGENFLSDNKKFYDCLIRDGNEVIKKFKSDPKWKQKFMNLISTVPDAFPVSDLMGGLTDGKICGSCGHNKEDWDDEFAICNEAFAHFFESSMGGSPYRLKCIKCVFPEAYKQYIEMIRPFIAKGRDELEREL